MVHVTGEEMKYITAEQFYEILESSARYFVDQVKQDTEEEVELQTCENWWYEFKQYMEKE